MTLEVRGCRQPQKLLGWLTVDREPRVGEWVMFIVDPPPAVDEGWVDLAAPLRREGRGRSIVLQVLEYGGVVNGYHLAFRCEDHIAMALLRSIAGFSEACGANPRGPHTWVPWGRGRECAACGQRDGGEDAC